MTATFVCHIKRIPLSEFAQADMGCQGALCGSFGKRFVEGKVKTTVQQCAWTQFWHCSRKNITSFYLIYSKALQSAFFVYITKAIARSKWRCQCARGFKTKRATIGATHFSHHRTYCLRCSKRMDGFGGTTMQKIFSKSTVKRTIYVRLE